MCSMEETLRQKLTESEELQPSHIEVKDTSTGGCGDKFEVVIVSDKFEGLSLLKRHRLVNSVLVEELKSIHAFSQKTYTQAQWDFKNKEGSCGKGCVWVKLDN
eukprot:m.72908 g.72908  ORF g.72908 m.72908 type:complete len:103 (+) comp8405_c0_seq2:134-442(+)